MLSRIHQLVEMNLQFIIATHSPIVMAYPGAMILQLEEKGLKEVNYEETEHYQIMKEFINKREKMLDILLEP